MDRWAVAAVVTPPLCYRKSEATDDTTWVGSLPLDVRFQIFAASWSQGARDGALAPYVPSAPFVVDAMLTAAKVGPDDYVVDLGCGDGRVVIGAAKRGAWAMGIDYDPQRIRECHANARFARVEERVHFECADLKSVDLTGATVVTMYLGIVANKIVADDLLPQCQPGTRIVSHAFKLPDLTPDSEIDVKDPASGRRARVFLWKVPVDTGASEPAVNFADRGNASVNRAEGAHPCR